MLAVMERTYYDFRVMLNTNFNLWTSLISNNKLDCVEEQYKQLTVMRRTEGIAGALRSINSEPPFECHLKFRLGIS